MMSVLALTLTACSHLSHEAKKMAGNYYIPEISEDQPLMELRKDGSCTVRAIKPGVLTFSIDGEWNVKDGQLTVELEPETIVTEGDSTLVGNIPDVITKKVIDYNGISLTVEDDGVQYVYHRRPN